MEIIVWKCKEKNTGHGTWKYTVKAKIHGTWKLYGKHSIGLLMPK